MHAVTSGQVQLVKVSTAYPSGGVSVLMDGAPDIQIEVVLRMHIRGLVTVPVSSRSITGIECPFELPSNSV